MLRLTMLVMIAAATLGAAPSPVTDYSALCAGWSGNWTVLQNADRQADGSWKTDNKNPDWQVKSLGTGKCTIQGIGDGSRFDVDTTGGDYVTTDWKDGKPGARNRYTFVRNDIENARSWAVEIVRAPEESMRRAGRVGSFARLTMIMAGDDFVIAVATKATDAEAYRLIGYTAHHRRP